VYAFQSNIGEKLGPKGLLWVYFLNPVTPLVLTFQRCIYNKVAPTALVKQPDGKYAVEHFAVLPLHGYWWYASLDVAVLAVSAGLFVIALAVFGRLEGNFAEEL
jgi:ABC-2 type transport system permease protein